MSGGVTRQPTRVFQVVWSFERFGGLERHLVELSLALARHGTEVLVFTEIAADPDNAYIRRLRAAGITVSGAGGAAALTDRLGRLPLGPLRGLLSQTWRLLRAAAPEAREVHPVTVALFARLDAAVTAGRPDAVHVHGTQLRQSWVVRWAAARGLPVMYTEQVTIDEWGGPTEPTAITTMIADAGTIACVSERARQSLVTALQGARAVAVVCQPVPGGDAAQPIRLDGPLRLLCVARLEHYKGIDVLLHAAAAARAAGVAFTLSLAGDGSERRKLEALARALGLADVVFLGAVPPEAIATALGGADLMVLPSRGEGLPVSVVEAMANGRPVLATRAGGTAEVVQDGVTGVMVDPERPDQLAAALVQIAADRPALQRMGEAARTAWANGGWAPDAVMRHVVDLYHSAADHARSTAAAP